MEWEIEGCVGMFVTEGWEGRAGEGASRKGREGKGRDEGSAWTMMGRRRKEGHSLFLFPPSLSISPLSFWIDLSPSASPSLLSSLGESTILYELGARCFGVSVCVGSMKPSLPGRIDSCTSCRCERSPRFGRACDDVRSGRKVGDRGGSRQPQSNKIQKGRVFWTTTCDGRTEWRDGRRTDGRAFGKLGISPILH
jgi:hypothetical protein